MINGISTATQLFFVYGLFGLGTDFLSFPICGNYLTMHLSVFFIKGCWYGAKLIREENYTIGVVCTVSVKLERKFSRK